jgi:hypothetical protein
LIQSRVSEPESERLWEGRGGEGREGGKGPKGDTRGSAGAAGLRLDAFLRNEGISGLSESPPDGACPRTQGAGVGMSPPFLWGASTPPGSATTQMLSLPLLEKMRVLCSHTHTPPPTVRHSVDLGMHRRLFLRHAAPRSSYTQHSTVSAAVCWLTYRMDSAKDTCIDVWFNHVGFCPLSSFLASILACVVLSHFNMIMGVSFFFLCILVFSSSLNMVANYLRNQKKHRHCSKQK